MNDNRNMMDTTKIYLLHLEDDRLDAELQDELLRAEGFEVDSTRVDRRADFITALERGAWTLILADYSMPGFDGLSALKIAREKTPDLPFIFVSGTMGEEVAIEALKNGATDYVLKQRLVRLAPVIRHALREAEELRERRRAQESLLERERQMTALVTSLDDIVIEFDAQGTYLNVWTSDENILAQPRTQLLGRRIDEVLGEENGRLFIEAVKRVLASGRPEGIEYPLEVRDGKRWFAARISPIVRQDESRKSVSTLVRDITGRKQAEYRIQLQLQRLQALSEIDRAISSSFDLRVSLDTLLNHVLSQLQVDASSILRFKPPFPTLEFAAGKGFRTAGIRKSSLLLGAGLAGQIAMERKTLFVSNLSQVGSQFTRAGLLEDEAFVGYMGVPLVAKGMLKGVLEVFQRAPLVLDPEWEQFLETLGGQAAIAIDNVELFEGMQQSNTELALAYDATIAGWSHAMDLRDKETEGHTQRVTEITLELAQRMDISQQELVHIRRGALLHDMGKMGVPDRILLKPDKLTEQEWEIMYKHPVFAREMLSPIAYLAPALDIPFCHHEKWDGTGYPRGLTGEEIPLAARIFAVVDVWDALTSDRPYRSAWTKEKTLNHLKEQSGKHFDPQVVRAFLELIRETVYKSPRNNGSHFDEEV